MPANGDSASRRSRRGGSVAVHPGAAAAEQDRPTGYGADGAVDRTADCRGQRDQHNLGTLAAYSQHPVAVLVAEVAYIRAGGLEDPQAQETEHGR